MVNLHNYHTGKTEELKDFPQDASPYLPQNEEVQRAYREALRKDGDPVKALTLALTAALRQRGVIA